MYEVGFHCMLASFSLPILYQEQNILFEIPQKKNLYGNLGVFYAISCRYIIHSIEAFLF